MLKEDFWNNNSDSRQETKKKRKEEKNDFFFFLHGMPPASSGCRRDLLEYNSLSLSTPVDSYFPGLLDLSQGFVLSDTALFDAAAAAFLFHSA